MSFIESMIEWGRQTFLPFGEFGLFVVAFMESSFFPVPPDIILIPLVLFNPSLGLWFAFVATLGSVIGSLLGYYIGKKGGRPLLLKFTSDHKVEKVEKYFKEHGTLAIFIAAFSPIPYKIFTITAGVLRFNIWKMIIVSILGRGGRFFAEAVFLMIWGQQILGFLIDYFEIATLLFVAIVILIYYIYHRTKS